jgi:SnoaL-like domain
MPWYPDLFSAPVLERIRGQAADARAAQPVPYFDGLRSGEIDALVGSFAGEPELHHPLRGRVKGRRGFEQFVADTDAWLASRNVVWGEVERIVTPERGIEEVVLTVDLDGRRIDVPVAVVADRRDDGRIVELRIYFGNWPLTGRHANRLPVLPADPDLARPDVVGDHQRAMAAGDVEGAVAVFESDGYVREPAGGRYVHRGRDELVALYDLFLSGGGIDHKQCAIADDGRACALEYNIVRWGTTELLPPEAGLAVYVRGSTGKLAGVRIYDDVDPPLAIEAQRLGDRVEPGGSDELKP